MKRFAALAFALLASLCASAQYNSFIAYPPGTAPSYEGLWWNAVESGWGVSIAHQGDVLFAVWYTYDHDGSPMWLLMPDARLVGDDMEGMTGMMDMEMMGMMRNPPIYSGLLYRSSMSANGLVMTEVGMATFLFKSRSAGVFAYTVGNFSAAKDITRIPFGPGTSDCVLGGTKALGRENFQDLWWNPADAGWGVNIAHQGDTLFATYYTYDAAGKGEWLVMSDTHRFDAGAGLAAYRGPMYRATGPAYDSRAWDASKVKLEPVGDVSFLFDATGRGQFQLSRAGAAQWSKPMVRMSFSAPASVCH